MNFKANDSHSSDEEQFGGFTLCERDEELKKILHRGTHLHSEKYWKCREQPRGDVKTGD